MTPLLDLIAERAAAATASPAAGVLREKPPSCPRNGVLPRIRDRLLR
jgi:hypothetical protein